MQDGIGRVGGGDWVLQDSRLNAGCKVRMGGAVWEVQDVKCRMGVQDERRGMRGAGWAVQYGRLYVRCRLWGAGWGCMG